MQIDNRILWVLQHKVSNGKSEKGYRDLQEKTPSPSDGIDNCTTDGRAKNSTKSEENVLHGLVRSPLLEGDHIRICNGR